MRYKRRDVSLDVRSLGGDKIEYTGPEDLIEQIEDIYDESEGEDKRLKIASVETKYRTLGDIRKKLDKKAKGFFQHPLTVFALQQGIGKTHMFIEYAKRHYKEEKIIFASPRHNHLTEIEKQLPKNSVRHWWGFRKQDDLGVYRGCPKLNQNIPILNELEKKGGILLNPKFVCNLLGCNRKHCSYHQSHIKSNKIDLVPIEYLGTELVVNQRPDIVVIDESIDKIDTYEYDSTLIDKCATIAQSHNYIGTAKSLRSLLPSPSKNSIQLIGKLEYYVGELITKCIKLKHFDDAKTLNKIYPVLRYYKNNIHFAAHFYHKPVIYDAFDLAFKHRAKVVFLNASFSGRLFKYFLKSYPNKNVGNIEVPVYISKMFNAYSACIRMYPDNMFWKGAFKPWNIDRTWRKIFKVIKAIEEYIPREKIGIITYKTVKYKKNNKIKKVKLSEKFLKEGYDTLHFWAESGLNILEDKYVLFIVGTPFIPPDECLKTWEAIHNQKTNAKPDDITMREGESWKISGGDMKKVEKGTIFRIVRRYRDGQRYLDLVPGILDNAACQMIDSIHRNRPLTHNRLVIVFGEVPPPYYYYLTPLAIPYYELVDIDNLTDYVEDHDVVKKNRVREIIEYVIENRKRIKEKDIARAFSLWNESRNPDVNLIKKIEKTIKSVENKA